jgi:transcriptional regulator with XRE-family HTH domain
MHIAQKFEHLLDTYRHADGRRWSGQEIDEATGGIVTRSYVTNLRKGRIENPGYEKMRALAKAMGFAPEVWFEDGLGDVPSIGQVGVSRGLAGRVEHLFEVVRSLTTGEPYTNAEVARMSLGDLSEEDVEGMRTGAIGDPTVGRGAGVRLRRGALIPLGSRGAAVRQGACGGFAEQYASGGNPRDFAAVRKGEAAGARDRVAIRKREQYSFSPECGINC